MKNNRIILVFGALLALVFTACSTVKYVPVETIKEVHVRDSVYYRDTLVRVELEKARISDFVDPSDTLVLQTDLARSTTFLDTTRNVLRGTIENIKPHVEKPVPVKHKIEYRDTVITRKIPVPYEVEKIVYKQNFMQKLLTWIGIFTVAWFLVKLLFKFLAGKQFKIFGKLVKF